MMTIRRPVAFLVPAVMMTAFAAAGADLRSLVEAERSFSRLSVEKGIRTAFLANLAPDSVVFRPRAVAGRPAYEKLSEVAARLSWRPVRADISLAGDMGYTTGPYELRPDGKGAEAYQYGHYVSVWRVQPDGSWKVVIDVGVRHPKPAAEAPDIVMDQAGKPLKAPGRADLETVRPALLLDDLKLAEAVARSGDAGALAASFAEDVRLYRPEREPAIGRSAIEKNSLLPEGSTWTPEAGAVAASADLAYTYGTLKAGSDEFIYFRIWKKAESDWRIVLDLLSPIPRQPRP